MNSLTITKSRKAVASVSADVEFWSLRVDGLELTSMARPFLANDSEITLHECEECYHCGRPEVLVRKYDEHSVIWFSKIESGYSNTIPLGTYYRFESRYYENLLGGSSGNLDFIDQEDFKHLFAWYSPHDPQEALYTEPELSKDRFGKRVFKIFDDNFRYGEFRAVSNGPTAYRTLKIGLDQADYPEAVMHFGSIGDRMVFRFVSHPEIPVWMEMSNRPDPFFEVFQIGELAG